MRKFVSLVVLLFAAVPAFALPVVANSVPEPETLSLLAIGGVAMLMARRKK
jgi:hypothetical protein